MSERIHSGDHGSREVSKCLGWCRVCGSRIRVGQDVWHHERYGSWHRQCELTSAILDVLNSETDYREQYFRLLGERSALLVHIGQLERKVEREQAKSRRFRWQRDEARAGRARAPRPYPASQPRRLDS